MRREQWHGVLHGTGAVPGVPLDHVTLTAAPPTAGPAGPATAAGGRLSPRYRWASIGVVLVITLAALEGMSVATVMPTAARELDGLGLYAWGFTAFLVAALVGTVDAGARCDRGRVVRAFLLGLGAFAAGCVVAGTAPTMPVFILGRAVQGYGAGALIVVVYVLTARRFREDQRPAVLGLLAAAWVIPALVGPTVAGAVTQTVGWRWVFVGLLPFVLLVLALLVPTLRSLPSLDAAPGRDSGRTGAQLGHAVLLAAGVAVVQAGATWSSWFGVAAMVAGLTVMALPLRRLLPAGALRLAPGLGATISARGLLAGSFLGAEAYLPLTLTAVHHESPARSGLPLTFAALSWASASWLQGRRWQSVSRGRLTATGFTILAAGLGILSLVALASMTVWVAALAWLVAGAGMGLAMPSISVATMAASSEDEQGENSAALQVSDSAGSVVTIALGGALVAAAATAGHGIGPAVLTVDLSMAVLALVGLLAARRMRA